ncbi:MAG TPA: TspO/MBR family protein [Candidatus Caenarcaniphilales bacterium]
MIKSWLVIGGVTLLVALGSALVKPRDLGWVATLQRPSWLFFEPIIPLIWTVIFTCGASSAYLVWQKNPGSFRTWFLMGCYLLLEIATVTYIPATLRLRSLTVGTVIGGTGAVLGILLTLIVWPMASGAALLLLPYVVSSPIGTYTTWEMIHLNPDAV